jgi:hypothetical protein
MSSWSRVGKPLWRTCAGIAPSLHCTVRLRPSGPFSAGLCWIKPSSGSVWRSPSSKPISTPAAADMTVRDRQPRDTPRRDRKPPVGAKRICARRQDGRVRRLWPHKSLHATQAAGRLQTDPLKVSNRPSLKGWCRESGRDAARADIKCPFSVPPWKAAGFLGMSVEVLLDTYGHHHPEFLRDAASAITSKPKQNIVSGVISGVDLAAYREKRQKAL